MLKTLLLIFVTLLSGCSFILEEPAKGKKELIATGGTASTTSSVKIEEFSEKSTTPTPSEIDFIQIMWRVPEDQVDSYRIKYGPEDKKDRNELRLDQRDLKVVIHPEFGKVYQALIPMNHSEERIFVSVSAIAGGVESEPSAVQEVQPLK